MDKLMVIYEITATLADETLVDKFERFMTKEHISAVLSTGAFRSAAFSRSGLRYRIIYLTESRQLLEAYLADHAASLRQETAANFTEGIVFSREEWDVLACFDNKDDEYL